MTMVQTGPFLDFEPDPNVWFVGPTPERPVEAWLPAATELIAQVFEIPEGDTGRREFVAGMLGLIARSEASVLPYYVIAWEAIEDVPTILFLGQVDRGEEVVLGTEPLPGEPSDVASLWLAAADSILVEPTVVEVVEASGGTVIHRALVYAHNTESNAVNVSVRYVVDTGDPQSVVLAQSMGLSAKDVLPRLDTFEDLLRTVTLNRVAG